MRLHLHAILAASFILSACSSLPAPVPPHAALPGECADWFLRLDTAIDAAGVRDAEAHRLPGYPHLRSNRLLASFAGEAGSNSTLYADWLDAMRELDQDAHDIEIRNLPAAAFPPFDATSKDVLRERILRCAKVMRADNARHQQAPPQMIAAARVPGSYSTALRALGLYPLFSIPFLDGVERWRQRTSIEFERQRALPANISGSKRYLPPAAKPGAEDPRVILARTGRNALGLPHFSAAERENLIATFAPVLEIEARGGDDKFGAIAWHEGSGGFRSAVNTAQPTVYHRIAFTRLGKEILTQLIYTV